MVLARLPGTWRLEIVLMPASALPPHLRETLHWDWPWPFSRIPRGWTAFNWGPPVLIAGTAMCALNRGDESDHRASDHSCRPSPISPAGTWQISRFPRAPWWAWPAVYISWSGKKGKDGKFRNVRMGPRWDNVDGYTNWTGSVFPFLISSRRYSGEDGQDTST